MHVELGLGRSPGRRLRIGLGFDKWVDVAGVNHERLGHGDDLADRLPGSVPRAFGIAACRSRHGCRKICRKLETGFRGLRRSQQSGFWDAPAICPLRAAPADHTFERVAGRFMPWIPPGEPYQFSLLGEAPIRE